MPVQKKYLIAWHTYTCMKRRKKKKVKPVLCHLSNLTTQESSEISIVLIRSAQIAKLFPFWEPYSEWKESISLYGFDMIPYAWTRLESGACKPPHSLIRWHVQKILQFLMTFVNMVKPENQVQAHCIRLWMLDKPPQKERKEKKKGTRECARQHPPTQTWGDCGLDESLGHHHVAIAQWAASTQQLHELQPLHRSLGLVCHSLKEPLDGPEETRRAADQSVSWPPGCRMHTVQLQERCGTCLRRALHATAAIPPAHFQPTQKKDTGEV